MERTVAQTLRIVRTMTEKLVAVQHYIVIKEQFYLVPVAAVVGRPGVLPVHLVVR